MKLKPKGRKIYRYKTRFERLKEFLRNTGAVVLTIGGTALLLFIGYSAGGPVMEFLEERNILTTETHPTTEVTLETVLPTETEPIVPTESTEPSETSAISTETEPPVEVGELCGYYLEADALRTEQALQKAIGAVPDGITHIIVPLKASGGRICYASSIADAENIYPDAMTLELIRDTITAAGYTPAAGINALEDSLYPQIHPETAYKIAGSDERWLDASPENGGKPWLSPFSTGTAEYLAALTGEISAAGFSMIFCEGFTFPDFSEEDLNMLDPRAGAPDRGTALASIASVMKAQAGEAEFYLTIDAAQLIDGKAEILKSGKPFTPDGYAVTVKTEADAKKAVIQALLKDAPCVLTGVGSMTAEQIEIDGNYILRPENDVADAQEDPTETSADTTESAGNAETEETETVSE